MRRSPFDGYDVQVSVDELASPSVWEDLQSTLGSIQSHLAGRWSTRDVHSFLRRRATVHVAVLTVVAAVLLGSVLAGHSPEEIDAQLLSTPSDSITLAAKTSIVARAIPFSSQGDESYTIQAGDTLTSIAHRVGVSEEALLAFNGFTSSDALSTGLRLRIPDLAKVPPEQLRIKDTAPHDSTPSVDTLPPQKPSPDLIIRQVQKGDNAYSLALAAGVSESTVLVSNNLQKDTVLSIGQTLVIPALNGRLVATKAGDTVAALAQTYSSTTDAILGANKLDRRTREVVPDQLVLVPNDTDTATAILKQATSTDTAAAAPRAASRPASSPGFLWPAAGTLSTYFSGWHNGIDIANAVGTPVRAAQAGQVVASGWDSSGYGYMVRIDHGNGLQTLYGHASRLLVKAGQWVDKGDTIMLMGSTGRSTGSHVHFSVFQGSGFAALNPLRYLP